MATYIYIDWPAQKIPKFFLLFLECRKSTKRIQGTKSHEIFAVSIIIIIINAKICFSTAFTMSADSVLCSLWYLHCWCFFHLLLFFLFLSTFKKFSFFHFFLYLSICLLHPFTILAKEYKIFSFSISLSKTCGSCAWIIW